MKVQQTTIMIITLLFTIACATSAIQAAPPAPPAVDTATQADITPTTTPPAWTVCAEKLYIRAGPSMSYAAVGAVKNGTPVAVLEEKGNWTRIDTNQWVNKNYLCKGEP
jgi:uncharacterized protein YgiM (DUF1202 family)